MRIHEKDISISTVIATIVAIIGTAAALAYYLSISRYNTTIGFIMLFGGYLIVILTIYYFLKWRYEEYVN